MKLSLKPILFFSGVYAFLGTLQTMQAKPSKSETPQWIWRADSTNDEPIYLRHQFEVSGEVKSASLYTTCDNQATIWVNGKRAGKIPDWGQPLVVAEAK